MAGGDEWQTTVCGAADQPEGLTFRHERHGPREFWWLTGAAGAVSFTLGHLPDAVGPDYGDAGFHSRTEREGWCETPSCWFLDDARAWCQPSGFIGDQLLAAYIAGEEAGLQGGLMALYDEWFGDG